MAGLGCSSSSPGPAAGTGDVIGSTPSGTSAISTADDFTYEVAPTVSAISPIAGPLAGGTVVTVTGTGFVGASAVMFGGTAGTITAVSATQVSATSPAATVAGVVDVTVITSGGPNVTGPADQFAYQAVPTVSAVNPLSGPLAGRSTVTITGTGLLGTSSVKFGTQAATSYSVVSATQVTATSPAEPAGTGDVTVATSSGTSVTSTADDFTYEVAPAVTSVSPLSGPLAGDSSVTISGTGLLGASAVSFGSTAATSYSVSSATQITALSPSAAAGTVDVIVSTPSGTSAASVADHFTYEVAPTVSAVSPIAGPRAGGTAVTVTGTGFVGASAVMFGGTAGTITAV